jgi:sortase (surface protein transpeptidase)
VPVLISPARLIRGRRTAAAVLTMSLLTLVAVPVWWAASRPRVEAGSLPAIRLIPASAPEVDPTAPEVPAIQVSSARLADHRQAPIGPVPNRVRIPAIEVDATVLPVGIDQPGRGMQIPADITKVGWYRFGPSPGQAGSALLVGHVDSSALGPGVFFRLRNVPVGALVLVAFTDGSSARFRVVARRSYPKDELPGRLFAHSGNTVLTLITCGGPFDQTTAHYQDNIVVYAVPSGG